MKKGVTNDAPMAVTTGGKVVFNGTHLVDANDPHEVLQQLLDEGHEVFIGMVVPETFSNELLKDIDDLSAELVGRFGVRIRRGRSR